MRSMLLAVVASILASGCVGPLVPVTNLDDRTAGELAETIPAYEAQETPASAAVIGPVTATSCKNKLWDPPATNENAISQLRLLARQRGANAVGNVVCEPARPTSLATNCWESISCTGTAIRTGAQGLPSRRR